MNNNKQSSGSLLGEKLVVEIIVNNMLALYLKFGFASWDIPGIKLTLRQLSESKSTLIDKLL